MTPTDVVTTYACMLDSRDWVGFRALFLDEIAVDYGAIGSLVGRMPADAWVSRCGLLAQFDATRHRLSNLRCDFQDDEATVDSYVDAVHFITIDGIVCAGDLAGSYRHILHRDEAGNWRIAAVTLTVAGYPMGRDRFDAVFAAARMRL